MDEKIELVQAHRQRYGLNACLRAVGLSKGTWLINRWPLLLRGVLD